MSRYSKARITIGGGLLIAAGLAGSFPILAPANAESALKQLISFACNDPKSCISITNTSPNGKAIVGVAQNNSGIFGRTNINTNKDPIINNPENGGVWGVDASTHQLDKNVGVFGTSANGSGGAGATAVYSPVHRSP